MVCWMGERLSMAKFAAESITFTEVSCQKGSVMKPDEGVQQTSSPHQVGQSCSHISVLCLKLNQTTLSCVTKRSEMLATSGCNRLRINQPILQAFHRVNLTCSSDSS